MQLYFQRELTHVRCIFQCELTHVGREKTKTDERRANLMNLKAKGKPQSTTNNNGPNKRHSPVKLKIKTFPTRTIC